MTTFDYRYLSTRCQFPVPAPGDSIYQEEDCGAPAVAEGFWDDGGKWFLCQEHLAFVLKNEEKPC